ncbi:hypothetical protein K9N68_01205 [Kovacikia minuta CCNUW1]|uniref:hypothetical protein n=1 Tax=Kovacikia minuta TaxID=2931930 RepID=UPI001CC9C253|nr:hypothetical protein [Kovacikia minuta]UBF26658.1 hypothetical protein K9N68_01205 [Kovacikia minuta CCNUW1]
MMNPSLPRSRTHLAASDQRQAWIEDRVAQERAEKWRQENLRDIGVDPDEL